MGIYISSLYNTPDFIEQQQIAIIEENNSIMTIVIGITNEPNKVYDRQAIRIGNGQICKLLRFSEVPTEELHYEFENEILLTFYKDAMRNVTYCCTYGTSTQITHNMGIIDRTFKQSYKNMKISGVYTSDFNKLYNFLQSSLD